MAKDKFEIDFLTNKDNYYLMMDSEKEMKRTYDIDLSDIALYRMDEVSFDDKAPRKEALENVLGTMKIDGINFIYLILGDGEGVRFYYGISRNYSADKDMELSVLEIGDRILEPSIKGNFRGSHTTEVQQEERKKIIDTIAAMREVSLLEGVPGSTKEDEQFQGVDRLADVMMGDRFGYMIIASPASYDEIKEIEKNLYDVYSRIVPLAKKNVQSGTNSSESIARGTSSGSSDSASESYSVAKNESVSMTEGSSETITKGTSHSTNTSKQTGSSSGSSSSSTNSSSSSGTSSGGNESKATAKNDSKSTTTGGSETNGKNKTVGTNKGVSEQKTEGTGTSESTSLEYVDKKSQDWIKYLDDIIIPRLDYGMGKGIFITTSFLFSDSKAVLKKLENTAISLYSGETGNKVPLRAFRLKRTVDDKVYSALRNFQLPNGTLMRSRQSEHEAVSRSALSQSMNPDRSFQLGNWITTNELAMIAGLPQKEVVGLALREEVEFGLNYSGTIKEEDKILLGNLVQSGNELSTSKVCLDKTELDKHVFVSGVTGSGKTTTCQRILIESNLPFLVVEPAKTEYRILKERYPDLLVFTLGNENVGTPFRLNPFEFFYPYESISSRVDMIKASIEAAFDMEAAIPQIIENAIYACYEDCGWNVSTNENRLYKDPLADGVYAFPTLEDLINKVPEVVDDQGFDVRLKNDYIGSIKARLMGLLMGAKGQMLNTKRSVEFEELLTRRVVLELEEIRNGSEKSLIMGFVLTNLMQAIKVKFAKSGKQHAHITLVEEAHRLLSKFVAGDSPSKKQGVETFADMLAEIRKYGECLVIVDQIPNKLTPEVLKNTNTKIVHKIFASDDKDAIGNTIVLDHDQKEFLSNLKTGRAVVFSQGYSKALQVQIEKITETDAEIKIRENDLREAVYAYYAENYKKGILMNTQFLAEKPDYDTIQQILDISRNTELCRIIYEYGRYYQKFPDEKQRANLNRLLEDEALRKLLAELVQDKLKKEPDLAVRREKQSAVLKEYFKEFAPDFMVRLLILFYLESKEMKKRTDIGKIRAKLKKKEAEEKIRDYLERYGSAGELSLEEVRNFADYIG